MINAAKTGAIIKIPAGTYLENINIKKRITLQGSGIDQTIIDGNGKDSCIKVQSGYVVTISGMTIRNGKGTNGGGIYNYGTTTISDCLISGNNASELGGGIYNSSGELTLNNVQIISNVGGYGGGIYSKAKMTMAGGIIDNNVANADAGGFFNGSGGSLVSISNCPVTNNKALGQINIYNYPWPTGWGGGFYNDGVINSITSCQFNNNFAQWRGGGAYSYGNIVLGTGCQFNNNQCAESDGGGLVMDEGAVVYFKDSQFNSNKSAQGAGIYNDARLTLENCLIQNNQAIGGYTYTDVPPYKEPTKGRGGGIYVYGSLMMKGKCIVSGNVVKGDGGGICCQPYLTVTLQNNVVVSDNTADSYSPSDGRGGGVYIDAGSMILNGTNVFIQYNKAKLPTSQSSWNNGYGVYAASSKLVTISGGFDPTKQVIGNTKI